ncbi:hypothetical protein MHU86_25344 [Fragilaria crotonensis]|nr:hypothetical protein MHU86_25344 [Fragilaria crotonensis]
MSLYYVCPRGSTGMVLTAYFVQRRRVASRRGIMCIDSSFFNTQRDHNIHQTIQIGRAVIMSRAGKQVGTNVTKKLMTEMQALIAFACYDSPTIAQGGDSMTESTMAEMMTALYFGGDDPEIISYLDQFINGLHRFTGLFANSEPDEFGQIVLTMPPKLHRHGGLNIFVGPMSITKELLSKKNFTNNERIAGRTLLRKAKDVVATCKKMMGLATALGSPYRDGTFPSGTNWDDYIKWCLVAMHNDCDREMAKHVNEESAVTTTTTTTFTTVVLTGAGETTARAATTVAATTTPITDSAAAGGTSTQVDNDRVGVMVRQTLPASGAFFKAGVDSCFLVWTAFSSLGLQ